jgi:hypothetical protein
MKIRELKTILQRRGYTVRPGKGSHSIWTHPDQPEKPVGKTVKTRYLIAESKLDELTETEVLKRLQS